VGEGGELSSTKTRKLLYPKGGKHRFNQSVQVRKKGGKKILYLRPYKKSLLRWKERAGGSLLTTIAGRDSNLPEEMDLSRKSPSFGRECKRGGTYLSLGSLVARRREKKKQEGDLFDLGPVDPGKEEDVF